MFLLVILFTLIFYYFFKKLTESRKRWYHLHKIPEPPAHCVIGHLSQIFQPPEQLFKYHRYKALNYYPIYKEWTIRTQIVHLIHPEDIKMVLTSTKHLKKYTFLLKWLGTGLLTSEGNKWHYRRKLITPAFHLSALQEFVEVFNKKAKKLVISLVKYNTEDYIDVTEFTSPFTLDCIKETSMGSSSTIDETPYINGVHSIGHLFRKRSISPWLYSQGIYYNLTLTGLKEIWLIKKLHKYTKGIIAERKQFLQKAPQGKCVPLLDLLLKSRDEGAIIDDEGIREEVDTFLFEGHDTTSSGLGFILLMIANHQHVQDLLYEELCSVLPDFDKSPDFNDLQKLKFMERCIKESLRLYPSVPVISRRNVHPIETYTGHTIPTETYILLQIYDMHRNPNVFPEPNKFDPDRFLSENTRVRHPFAFIPFSAGPRNCIGQKFAILKLKCALCAVLKQFVLEPVDTPESVLLTTDIVLRAKDGIKIKFVNRCK